MKNNLDTLILLLSTKLHISIRDDYKSEATFKCWILSDKDKNYVATSLYNLEKTYYKRFCRYAKKEVNKIIDGRTEPEPEKPKLKPKSVQECIVAYYVQYIPTFREQLFKCTCKRKLVKLLNQTFDIENGIEYLDLVREIFRGNIYDTSCLSLDLLKI